MGCRSDPWELFAEDGGGDGERKARVGVLPGPRPQGARQVAGRGSPAFTGNGRNGWHWLTGGQAPKWDRLAWFIARAALEVADRPNCTSPSCSLLLPHESLHGSALGLATHFPGMLPREQGTLITPCPQHPPHPHPPSAHPHPNDPLIFLASLPRAALTLVALRAKRWVGSGPMPVCVSWLTPFTPRKPPTASHQRKGLQRWHG